MKAFYLKIRPCFMSNNHLCSKDKVVWKKSMMAMKFCGYHQQVRALQRDWPRGHHPEKGTASPGPYKEQKKQWEGWAEKRKGRKRSANELCQLRYSFHSVCLKSSTNQCEPEVRPEPGQATTLSFNLPTPPAEASESLCGYLRQGHRSNDSSINGLWFFIWLPGASRKAQLS